MSQCLFIFGLHNGVTSSIFFCFITFNLINFVDIYKWITFVTNPDLCLNKSVREVTMKILTMQKIKWLKNGVFLDQGHLSVPGDETCFTVESDAVLQAVFSSCRLKPACVLSNICTHSYSHECIWEQFEVNVLPKDIWHADWIEPLIFRLVMTWTLCFNQKPKQPLHKDMTQHRRASLTGQHCTSAAKG